MRQGKKSEAVLTKIGTTFTTLCALADFASIPKTLEKKKNTPDPEKKEEKPISAKITQQSNGELSLKYSINIELPTTRDQLVYDAIFKSIKENLL